MQRRFAWILLVSGLVSVGCGLAHARARRAGPSCVKLTKAMEKRAAAAEAWTKASFARTLAARKLTMVPLAESMTNVGYQGPLAAFHPVGTVFTEGGKTYVAGPSVNVPSGSIPLPFFEFVRDDKGDLWRLDRRPHYVSSATVTVCGCGPVGSGVRPRTEQLRYELPAGATYRGDLAVTYDAKAYILRPSRTDDRGIPCQPPP